MENLNPTGNVQKAEQLFCNGYNCAQSVLAAYAEECGLDEEKMLQLAAGFGGGIGGSRDMCGALSAAVMVYGLMQRGYKVDDIKDKAAFYSRVRDLIKEFGDRAGATDCKTLLTNASLRVQADPSVRSREYYHNRPCLNFVRIAAELLTERK